MQPAEGNGTISGGLAARSTFNLVLAAVVLMMALAAPASPAELESDHPIDVLRSAVLRRDYGRWWDILSDDSRGGRNREEFIERQQRITAHSLHVLEARHGVPFTFRVRDFCAWSGLDREYFQGQYRMEFISNVHLAGKSWMYVTTCYFKLRVVGGKVSLTYTEFATRFGLVPARVVL